MASTISIAIQSFLDSLKFEKRSSQHTIRSYRDDLVQFIDFIQIQFDEEVLEQISSSMVRSWLASLKDAKLSAKSINRKLSALKSFFKYQMKVGVLETTPVANIIPPKIGKRLPSFLEQEDVSTLLNNVVFPDTWQGKTDRLLIAIFYNTGMRLSELVNLKEANIDLGNSNIKVLGKGNKERVIPISKKLLQVIVHYKDSKRKELTHFNDEVLLVNEKGKKLYDKYVYTVVKKYLGEVTTLEKKSPHILRHSFATHLMNNGADLNAVKELLGHSSLAATQVYTHNNIEKLKDIHKKAHPKS